MRVLEIKNNLVKVSYNAEDNLKLGGFVVIEDENAPYVAQIVSLKADNGIVYAIVKLIFTFNEEGIVQNYDGTIPALNANLTKLPVSELLDILPVKNPLKLGNLAQEDFILKTDDSILKNNLLICSDKQNNTNVFISNCLKQLENNAKSSIVIDTSGNLKGNNKLIFGKDFKLPLNFETINFIYANELNDVDATSKAVIQDIFLEVQEFTRNVAGKFIPFNTFIEVVSQQYKESGMPELALLKNKLLKYKEDNVFAESKEEIKALKEYIKDNYTVILDISSVDSKLQKEIIFYTYSILEEMITPTYSFVQVDNNNSDKKLLKLILKENKIYTNIICSHNYKYVYELKEKASDLVLFAPQTTTHDFAGYNTFLNKLNSDEFIVWGQATQNIPLVVELAPIEIVKPQKEESNDTLQVKEIKPVISNELPVHTKTLTEPKTPEAMIFETPVQTSFLDDTDTYEDLSDNLNQQENNLTEFSTLETENSVSEQEPEDIIEPLPFLENDDVFSEKDLVTESSAKQISPFAGPEIAVEKEYESIQSHNITEIQEEPEPLPEIQIPEEDEVEIKEDSETFEDYIQPVESYIQEPSPLMAEFDEPVDRDALIEQVAKDVDETFIYSKLEDEQIDSDRNKDILTEDDLNFIEDINYNEPEIGIEETVEEFDSQPEIIEEENTSPESDDDDGYEPEPEPSVVVPVYKTEEFQNTQTFEQGDQVSHPKYGEGVVEKMIKYGSKTLCSINFVNVGRRLLDPAISEITKF